MIRKVTNSNSMLDIIAGTLAGLLTLLGLLTGPVSAQSSPNINAGTLNGTKIFTGSFSPSRTGYTYDFRLPTNGMNVFAQVENMNGAQILDVVLFDSRNNRLAFSVDNVAHRISRTNLSGGWYRFFFQSLAANTRYRLILTATPNNSYPDAGNSANAAADLGMVNPNGQIRIDSVSPGDVDWFRLQVAQNSTQVRIHLFDAQANDSARVALVNSSLRTMREVLVSENSRGPLMDISLAAGTYYLSVTAAQGASGAIGTGYRLLVTGQANTSPPLPPPPTGNPPAPPSPGGNPPPRPFDRGSNNRQFPTGTGGIIANRATIIADSIAGGDSDDWYSIDVTYTTVGNTLPVGITLTNAANVGIELYTMNSRDPFDRRLTSGMAVKAFDRLYLVRGRYLIHVFPLTSASPASSYTLTARDLGGLP